MREVTTVKIARRVARQLVRHAAGRKMGARTRAARRTAFDRALFSLRSAEPSRPRAPKLRTPKPRVAQRHVGGSAVRTVTGELRHVSRKHRLRDRRERRDGLREIIGSQSSGHVVGNGRTVHFAGGTVRLALSGAGDSRWVFVGEMNPYGRRPGMALFPAPANSAGHRLCQLILQSTEEEYLARYHRRNLCTGTWSLVRARAEAAVIQAERPGATLILLGAKVCSAFGEAWAPFTWRDVPGGGRRVVLPHPSGLSRSWNAPDAFERARTVLREAGVLACADPTT